MFLLKNNKLFEIHNKTKENQKKQKIQNCLDCWGVDGPCLGHGWPCLGHGLACKKMALFVFEFVMIF